MVYCVIKTDVNYSASAAPGSLHMGIYLPKIDVTMDII